MEFQKSFQRILDTTDEIGIIQHSNGSIPDLTYGYSIDDSMRALIVLSRVYPKFNDNGKHKSYLDYILKSRRDDGFFHNFYELIDGEWKFRDESSSVLGDCLGRVIWALSEFESSRYSEKERRISRKTLLERLHVMESLKPLRSRALSLIGLSQFLMYENNPEISKTAFKIAESIADDYHYHSQSGWEWFEDEVTYCNGKIPHSMILAGKVLENETFLSIGNSSLNFLMSHSFKKISNHNDLMFHAIGNKGWFKKGTEPALYDEQTVEAGDMVEVCVDATKFFGKKYEYYARTAFEWFSGNNRLEIPMIDSVTGGGYDALLEDGVNKNQGAESVLSYALAYTKLRELEI